MSQDMDSVQEGVAFAAQQFQQKQAPHGIQVPWVHLPLIPNTPKGGWATPDPFKTQVGGNHYAHFAIQPGEFISKNELKWYEGNIIKYVTRSRFKGQLIQDLEKARHYLDMAIKEVYDNQSK